MIIIAKWLTLFGALIATVAILGGLARILRHGFISAGFNQRNALVATVGVFLLAGYWLYAKTSIFQLVTWLIKGGA